MTILSLFRIFDNENSAETFFNTVDNADMFQLKDGRWIVLYQVDIP